MPAASDFPEIVHEDEAVLAVNKPSGLLVAPDRWDRTRPSLVGMLLQRWQGEVVNVHRLDADTSGLLICAKGKAALRLLASQFDRRVVEKQYQALVQGAPPENVFEITLPLGEDRQHKGRMRVDRKSGREAITLVRVAERFRGWTLLDCFPQTGRTHQIRVHLAAAGWPIVCDPFYGRLEPVLLSQIKRGYKPKAGESEKPLLNRLALHSLAAAFVHPGSGLPMRLEAPQAHDFALALKYLRQWAAL